MGRGEQRRKTMAPVGRDAVRGAGPLILLDKSLRIRNQAVQCQVYSQLTSESDGDHTWRGECFIVYITVKPLSWAPETNITLHANYFNYSSIKN